MTLTPWFTIGIDGPPVRSGNYEFELWLDSEELGTVFHTKAGYSLYWRNQIVTPNDRIVGLRPEDKWRGVMG